MIVPPPPPRVSPLNSLLCQIKLKIYKYNKWQQGGGSLEVFYLLWWVQDLIHTLLMLWSVSLLQPSEVSFFPSRRLQNPFTPAWTWNEPLEEFEPRAGVCSALIQQKMNNPSTIHWEIYTTYPVLLFETVQIDWAKCAQSLIGVGVRCFQYHQREYLTIYI